MTAIAEESDMMIPFARPRTRRMRGVRSGDRTFNGVLTAAALAAPIIIVMFVAVLAYGAWPAIHEFRFRFLTSTAWEPNPDREEYGALAFIVGTLVSSILAMLLACAEYSPESAQNNGAIDGMNRNVLESQGSSIQDRNALSAPPVKPAYSSDR